VAWLIGRVRDRQADADREPLPDRRESRVGAAVAIALAVVVAIPMALQSWAALTAVPDITLSTGRGGYPGQREAAVWFRDNAPEGSVCAVAAANLAALVQFYSGHDCVGLNVPAQVRRRNPVDVFVDDPVQWVAENRIHYVITDVISEMSRDALTAELDALVVQFHGRLVHEVTGTVRQGDGPPYESWLVRIYEVRP